MAGSSAADAIPRSALFFGLPLVGLLLVGTFFVRGFPYDVASDRISTSVERAYGVRISVSELGPSLRLTGPGLVANDVRLHLRTGEVVTLDSIFARPAWSLSWFRGAPAVRVEIEGGAMGAARGIATLGAEPGWDGVLDAVDLSALPTSTWAPGGAMEGIVSGQIDVQVAEDGPIGSAELAARDGAISLPSLPVDIPFDQLDAEIELGGDSLLEISSLTGAGPIVSGSGTGKVARAASFKQSPLSLQFDLSIMPALAGAVRSAGIRVDRQGKARLRVTGTIAEPRLR